MAYSFSPRRRREETRDREDCLGVTNRLPNLVRAQPVGYISSRAFSVKRMAPRSTNRLIRTRTSMFDSFYARDARSHTLAEPYADTGSTWSHGCVIDLGSKTLSSSASGISFLAFATSRTVLPV